MSDDFMCRCNPENLAECDAVYAWALGHLQCNAEDLVSYIMYTLTDMYGVSTIEMFSDQWAAVRTDKYLVQCDRIEDGLARLLQLYVTQD